MNNSSSEAPRVAVIGGGLAGIAAATALCEQGMAVTLYEADPQLGGRLACWEETLSDGTRIQMERGFHAFFRNYANLRALIRRVDPELRCLDAVDDYPVLDQSGHTLSFEGLPKQVPLNLAALIMRAGALPLREALRVPPAYSAAMVDFSMEGTFEAWDKVSARDFIDALRISGVPRRLLFDVFAHSFFNDENEMSAAEMLHQFHFYFLANSKGLIFDVTNKPFSEAFVDKIEEYISERGCDIRCASPVKKVLRSDDGSIRVESANGDMQRVDDLVLALNVNGLKRLAEASRDFFDSRDMEAVDSLDVAGPFVVQRLFLDRDVRADRANFLGTTGFDMLDNITLMHRIEDESRDWASRNKGSVIELHAYALQEGANERHVADALMKQLFEIYPELRGAKVIDECLLMRQDCPGFRLGSWRPRPGVEIHTANCQLAGDFVKLDLPSALMERAVLSGLLAANNLLEARGLQTAAIAHLPKEGWLRRARAAPKRQLSAFLKAVTLRPRVDRPGAN